MKKETIVLLAFLIAKFILQYLVVHPIYDLQRDEYLHLDQAHHLAWGFHSVPPLSSWISWIILKFGNGYFWVKFFPALFGALTIMVVWETVKCLKGNLFACTLAATAILLSVFLRINLLYQPNSLDYLCWTTIYYSLIRYFQTNNYRWLYFLSIVFAIGFLNKYNITFCIIGLIPALLITPQRNLFSNPKFYLAIALALLLIMPNLVWQYQNDFPVFKHMKELKETQLINVNPLDFLKEQFLFFVSAIFIIIGGFLSLFIYAPFKPFRFILYAYIFTIAVFLGLSAKGYYAIGLYPIFFAFGAVYLETLLKPTKKIYFLRYAAFVVVIILALPLFKIALPIKTPEAYVLAAKNREILSEHRWEDGKTYPIAQDFADMLGWRELAHKVDSVYKAQNDPNLFIFCDNYGQAGAINYYTTIKTLRANSFNADYINWINLPHPITKMINIKETGEDMHDEFRLFEQVDVVDSITNPYAREKGTKIILLTKPKSDVTKFIQMEVDRLKSDH